MRATPAPRWPRASRWCDGDRAAVALSEQRTTIEELIEPLLVRLGVVVRTARDRGFSAAGFDRAKIVGAT